MCIAETAVSSLTTTCGANGLTRAMVATRDRTANCWIIIWNFGPTDQKDQGGVYDMTRYFQSM
jgi:hypothetical protein